MEDGMLLGVGSTKETPKKATERWLAVVDSAVQGAAEAGWPKTKCNDLSNAACQGYAVHMRLFTMARSEPSPVRGDDGESFANRPRA